jgi:hypothetical protein
MRKRYIGMKKKEYIACFLCAIGIHKFRVRKNGPASERVCMRPGCNHREKLYRLKDGKATIWNEKRIPARGRSFRKTEN